MTYSSLTNVATDTFQKSSRGGAGIGFIQLHHTASTNGPSVVNMMTSGSRQVSANYVVYNDGTLVGVVPEEFRAWTSGSAWADSQAITFEISNEAVGEPWPVSNNAHEKVAQVAADISRRYGVPLNRWNVYGHGEMEARWGVSYGTRCPGGLNIDWIVGRAIEINAGPKPVINIEETILAIQDGGYIAVQNADKSFARGAIYGPNVPKGVIVAEAKNGIEHLQAMGNLAGIRVFNDKGEGQKVGAPIKVVGDKEFNATVELAARIFGA